MFGLGKRRGIDLGVDRPLPAIIDTTYLDMGREGYWQQEAVRNGARHELTAIRTRADQLTIAAEAGAGGKSDQDRDFIRQLERIAPRMREAWSALAQQGFDLEDWRKDALEILEGLLRVIDAVEKLMTAKKGKGPVEGAVESVRRAAGMDGPHPELPLSPVAVPLREIPEPKTTH